MKTLFPIVVIDATARGVMSHAVIEPSRNEMLAHMISTVPATSINKRAQTFSLTINKKFFSVRIVTV